MINNAISDSPTPGAHIPQLHNAIYAGAFATLILTGVTKPRRKGQTTPLYQKKLELKISQIQTHRRHITILSQNLKKTASAE